MAGTGRGRGAPTLVQVAVAAGVDPAIVSRLLNDDPKLRIRPETRERVLRAIQEFRYRPNAAGRALRTARAGAVGLLIPDFTNPIYAEIIAGAEAAVAERGEVLLTASSSVHSAADYLELLGQGRIDRLLVAGHTFGATERLTQLPVLWLNRRPRGATRFVVLDDTRAAAMAVEHLIELGHRRIAHLAGPAEADTARRRGMGYRRALRAAGLEVDPTLEFPGDYTPAGGAAAMAKLLAHRNPPTAVFVANVASAIGAMAQAAESGVPIPGRLSLVAVHDAALAAYLTPALTTVQMPLRELAARGVQMLFDVDETDPVREVVDSPMQLLVRSSTAEPGPPWRLP